MVTNLTCKQWCASVIQYIFIYFSLINAVGEMKKNEILGSRLLCLAFDLLHFIDELTIVQGVNSISALKSQKVVKIIDLLSRNWLTGVHWSPLRHGSLKLFYTNRELSSSNCLFCRRRICCSLYKFNTNVLQMNVLFAQTWSTHFLLEAGLLLFHFKF